MSEFQFATHWRSIRSRTTLVQPVGRRLGGVGCEEGEDEGGVGGRGGVWGEGRRGR